MMIFIAENFSFMNLLMLATFGSFPLSESFFSSKTIVYHSTNMLSQNFKLETNNRIAPVFISSMNENTGFLVANDDPIIDVRQEQELASMIQQSSKAKQQNRATKSLGLSVVNAKKWATVGQSDAKRLLHFSLGFGSLLLGGYHFFEMILKPNGGFTIESSEIEVILMGFFHTATAFMGNTLLKNNKSEAARNAMIAPVPYQNLWFSCMALTQWCRGSDALVDMNSTPMIIFSLITLVVVQWQASKSFVSGKDKSGIWFENPAVNAAVTVTTYTGLITVFTSLALTYCMMDVINPGYMSNEFTSIIDTFPEYGHCMSNVFLSFEWTNNLGVFMATLFKYKVIDIRVVQNIFLAVNGLGSYAIIICLFITDVGVANETMLNSLLSGLDSFVLH